MATGHGADTSRTVVKTYVPAYQKERWADHADQLEMSQSEFVRTMVQAGRRGFGGDDGGVGDVDGAYPGGGTTDEPPSPVNPADARRLEEQVLDVLSTDEHRPWEQLVDEFAAAFERTLQELQAAGRVVHSPRNGGYALVEADER